jgi:hypothetical protein
MANPVTGSLLYGLFCTLDRLWRAFRLLGLRQCAARLSRCGAEVGPSSAAVLFAACMSVILASAFCASFEFFAVVKISSFSGLRTRRTPICPSLLSATQPNGPRCNSNCRPWRA